MNTNEMLIESAKQFNIELKTEDVDRFIKYKDLLLKWNDVMNLTAITDENEIVVKHFIDSISPMLFTNFSGLKIIDVGTGAGFPGLPLKIVNNSINLTLLDSLNKRINFLKEISQELNLQDINIIHGRAEDYGVNKDYREQFDISISRAVAKLSALCEYCLPFVKVGGYFISLKGPSLNEELLEAKKAIDVLGGTLEDVKKIKLPYFDIEHSIVYIKKIRQTSLKYPRKAGKPTKEPII